MRTGMVVLFRSRDLVEAQLVHQFLRANAFRSEIRNELFIPIPTEGAFPEVWVASEQFHEARNLLEAARGRDTRGGLSFASEPGLGQLSLPSIVEDGVEEEARAPIESGAPVQAAHRSSSTELECPRCKELVPANFGECWNCQFTWGCTNQTPKPDVE